MPKERWTEDQTKLAFYLYCQLPFGKLHRGNSEIIELASLLGRTPSSVAMKLVNFASLDPAITSTGRKGLSNASDLDQEVWNEFNADWEGLATECQRLRAALAEGQGVAPALTETVRAEDLADYTGETKQAIVQRRLKQHFFRRAVLSSYRGRCCLSGISDHRLLLASHIVPWSMDKPNRLNPRNGLCLSALHDKAFDKGLIALSDDFRVLISDELRENKESAVTEFVSSIDCKQIEQPERFLPSVDFVRRHRERVFLGSS